MSGTLNIAMIGAVAIGGAIGSVGRYLVSVGAGRLMGPGFPWGTLAVNIVGSLAMGLLIGIAAQRLSLNEPLRSFLVVGFLGGFTTFSTFSLDAAAMLQRGNLGLAAAYVGGSVVVGIAALFGGMYLARLFLN